jgi:hypothetical protein
MNPRPEARDCGCWERTIRSASVFVVIQDLSRFARNLQDQIATKADLTKPEILVRSVYVAGVEGSAIGSFNECFVGVGPRKLQTANSGSAFKNFSFNRLELLPEKGIWDLL